MADDQAPDAPQADEGNPVATEAAPPVVQPDAAATPDAETVALAHEGTQEVVPGEAEALVETGTRPPETAEAGAAAEAVAPPPVDPAVADNLDVVRDGEGNPVDVPDGGPAADAVPQEITPDPATAAPEGDGWEFPAGEGQPAPVSDAPADLVPASEDHEALVALALDAGITNARDLSIEQLQTALGAGPLPEFDPANPEQDGPATLLEREGQEAQVGPGETATLETRATRARRDQVDNDEGPLPVEVRSRLLRIGISRPLLAEVESRFAAYSLDEKAQAVAAMGLQTDPEVRHELDELEAEMVAANPPYDPHAAARSRRRGGEVGADDAGDGTPSGGYG